MDCLRKLDHNSIDAIGCQKTIAQNIVDHKADYVLVLKDNHRQLFEDVKRWLDSQWHARRLAVHETIEKDHGRIETRRYTLSDQIDWLEHKPQWAALKAVGMVESIREIGDKVSVQPQSQRPALRRVKKAAGVTRA